MTRIAFAFRCDFLDCKGEAVYLYYNDAGEKVSSTCSRHRSWGESIALEADAT